MRGTTKFAIVLIVVAGLGYSLGRKHGAARRDARPSGPVITGEEPVVPHSGFRTAGSDGSSPRATRAFKQDPASLDRSAPFVRNMLNARAGYEAAMLDLDAALKQIELLPASERSGFTTGVFSFIARHRTPAEALALCGKQPPRVRAEALRALASEWISTRSSLDEEKRFALQERVRSAAAGKFGLEVELAVAIASSGPDDELATAWLNAFSTHPARSEMLPILASSLLRNNPELLLDRVTGWTEWERERAARVVLEEWASRAPQEAWTWFESQRERLGEDLASCDRATVVNGVLSVSGVTSMRRLCTRQKAGPHVGAPGDLR